MGIRKVLYRTLVKWDKPALDVEPGANIVQPGRRDSTSVWLDVNDKDPSRRFKMLRYTVRGEYAVGIHFSADGIHWSEAAGRGSATVILRLGVTSTAEDRQRRQDNRRQQATKYGRLCEVDSITRTSATLTPRNMMNPLWPEKIASGFAD